MRLKDNQLENISIIYHDVIQRLENFLEAHEVEFPNFHVSLRFLCNVLNFAVKLLKTAYFSLFFFEHEFSKIQLHELLENFLDVG